MKKPVLELVNVSEYLSDNFAVQGVTLSLYPGEVHMIVGENGSGKSEIMKLISGISSRDGGDIVLNGEPVRFSSVHESRQRGIHHLLQDPLLFENLSVAENLFFDYMPREKGFLKTLERNRMYHGCMKLFDEFGISIDPFEHVRKLGFAERRLLEAVRTCVSEFKVVIFDEPSASMNDPERQILFRIVNRLRERGTGVFYISHRYDEIKHIGDRVTVIHRGSVVDTMDIPSLDHETLFRIMTGQIRRERYPRLEVRPGPEILSVRHLRAGRILKDVTFSLRKGEILGITGLMGSGRTWLAHCLFGINQPSGGSIAVEGREVKFAGPGDALEAGFAMIPEDRQGDAIFQQHDLAKNMTIVALKRFIQGLRTDVSIMRQLVRDYTDRLRIRPEDESELLQNFSGGNQQKVMIARWFMQRSRIYIMDEPTRGVDIASRVDIYNAMNDVVSHGASILLISSEIEEILGLCDRILVLSGGRIVCNLSRAEATKEKILSYAINDE